VELAEAAAREGCPRVVVVGGDGTVSEAVDGLLRATGGAPSEVELGIVPAGTGGDLARTLGIPRKIDAALLCAARGRAQRIDVGRVRFTGNAGDIEERHFVNVADAGLGGETVERVESLKRLPGTLAYLLGSLVAIARHRSRPVRIWIEGAAPFRLDAGVVALANGRTFGGGMRIAPRSDPADGALDLVAMPYLTPLRALGLLAKVYSGTALDDSRVIWRRVAGVTLEPLDGGEVLLDVDGEQPGRLPATFEVLPKALIVRV